MLTCSSRTCPIHMITVWRRTRPFLPLLSLCSAPGPAPDVLRESFIFKKQTSAASVLNSDKCMTGDTRKRPKAMKFGIVWELYEKGFLLNVARSAATRHRTRRRLIILLAISCRVAPLRGHWAGQWVRGHTVARWRLCHRPPTDQPSACPLPSSGWRHSSPSPGGATAPEPRSQMDGANYTRLSARHRAAKVTVMKAA